MMDILIQEAMPHQATELSEIAFKVKSYWGYTTEQLEVWRTMYLTISAEYILMNQVWIAWLDNQILGFVAIEQDHGETILDHLWILPDYIGRGIGRRLFLHIVERFPEFVFTSDPHADNFYYKMGASKIGETYSDQQKKMLTTFKYSSKNND